MLRKSISTASRLSRKARLLGLSRNLTAEGGRPLVVGFLGSPSGIGTGGRLLLEALYELGLEPAALDLTPRFQPGLEQVDWAKGRTFDLDDGSGPVIVHANPPEVPYALSELGPSRLQGRYRIGYWAWEFERMPRTWERELGWFHEIWAPSSFTASAIEAAKSAPPVRPVGYPLHAFDQDGQRVSALREGFGAAPGKLVYYAFDMRSSMDRKNPIDAVEIFKRASADHPDARLILKVNGWGWAPDHDQRLLAAINGDPRVQVLKKVLSDQAMAELMAACDVYLSPHRCEGFGLMLASALLAGKVVVMTGWSGNMDFANLPGALLIDYDFVGVDDVSGVYANSVGRWAAPKVDDAVRILRRLLSGEVQTDPHNIKSTAVEYFGAQNWLERVGTTLQVVEKGQDGR